MKLIPADYENRLQIPGVPEPVLRPVDIDKSKTEFENLRSLRIYRFDPASVIDGHAEEDEVMIVLLSGSIDLTLMEESSSTEAPTFTLSAVTEKKGGPCAAYLPPHAAYRLVALTSADVAYARATPAAGPPPRVFRAAEGGAGRVLWEEVTYPSQLRMQVWEVAAGPEPVAIAPLKDLQTGCEALLHVRAEGAVSFTDAGAEPQAMASWDTLAVFPTEQPLLHFTAGMPALVLVVAAPAF